jgi:hypothetical protein
MRGMNRIMIVVAGVLMSCLPSMAQKFGLSTNLLEDLCLGTMNMELSYSLSQKWTLTAGAKYNPFTFKGDEPAGQFQLRQRSVALGARMWPWHTGSGWWLAGKLRYQEYSWGGLLKKTSQEGDRYGAGLYAGYTYMLNAHINLEFALGCWAGLDDYRRYSCANCGFTLDSGRKAFLLPDDIMLALVYVF